MFPQRTYPVDDLFHFDASVAPGCLGVLVTQRFLDQGDVAGQLQ